MATGGQSAVSLTSLWFLCVYVAKESPVTMTEDTKEQLLEASSATKKAFNSYRREADPEDHYTSADGQPSSGDKNQDDGEMSFVIVIMQPILRFLQLLCENHNRDLQVGLSFHSGSTDRRQRVSRHFSFLVLFVATSCAAPAS